MPQAVTNILDTDSSHSPAKKVQRPSSHTMFALLAPSLSTLYKTYLKLLTTAALSTRGSSTTEQATTSKPLTAEGPPPAILIPKIHPLELQVTAEVEAYFIKYWPFPNVSKAPNGVNGWFRSLNRFKLAHF